MKTLSSFGTITALVALAAWMFNAKSGTGTAPAAEPAPNSPQSVGSAYHVLAPIESGNLLLFPVVPGGAKSPAETPFITLDEGIRDGQVEVTEAGKARGLVRPRGGVATPTYERGDQVNTLVLVNHSQKPLLLLAGEIVTGGKQDRIIAKDRIVPSDADPIDLSVFCIEPGRWTESSATLGSSAKSASRSIMAQPAVRERAMAEQDQQSVWNSVRSAISGMAMAASPGAAGTSSYAKAVQNDAVSEKVDQAAAPIVNAREQVLAQLRSEHAVGVVVAVHGEIIWADLFADTDLLSRYWTKLVRSYAAESLTTGDDRAKPTAADAQSFLDAPAGSSETAEGETGVYRYHQFSGGRAKTFVLESLLPGTGYNVHTSRMKLRDTAAGSYGPHPPVYPEPLVRPQILR